MNLDSNLRFLTKTLTKILRKLNHTIHLQDGKNSLLHRKVGVEVNQNNKLVSNLLQPQLRTNLKNLRTMIINHL